jgi:hypothetical protein
LVTGRQARMAAIVQPFLDNGTIRMRLLSSDTEHDHQRRE